VHHPYAQGSGNPRSGDPPPYAIDPDLTGVWPHQPIRDMHQGGLPGPVFPQQRMHLAWS
jgi:hypothetical protein